MSDEHNPAIQAYYADDYAWCYGCGRNNELGHHFETRWNGEETLTEYQPRPEHMAIPGFVYGGLLASLMDCHSTGSAALALYRQGGHEPGSMAPVPRCVTASLKVDFLKPTPLGGVLRVRGQIKEIGLKKVIVSSDLYAGEIIVVRAEVVAVLAPSSMVPQ
ncbi:MAG: PaaI family thioesterase [Sulfobacillus sp.]